MKINSIIGQPDFSNESTTEPVSLTEAKAWLKIGVTDDDDLITDLITSARSDCETCLNISLIERTVTVSLKIETCEMLLPYQPFRANEDENLDFISIVDQEGNAVATTGYKLIGGDFKFLSWWSDFVPSPRNNFYTPQCWFVTVQYNAGYAADEIPKPFKTAILKRLAELYEHRGDIKTNANELSDAFISLSSYRKVV